MALIRKTLSKWNDDPTLRFGAGLAYYTAFAVVPLVFIVVEVATWMVGQSAAEGVLMEEAERLIGEQGAQAINQLLDSWQKNGVSGLAAVVEAAGGGGGTREENEGGGGGKGGGWGGSGAGFC